MNKRRNFRWCSHSTTITTITAGLAREVCEACGHIRIQFVEPAVQIYPTPRRSVIEAAERDRQTSMDAPRTCGLCSQTAVYLIPGGLVCDEHAWQAAARTNWDDTDPWVPIRIDKSNA